MQKNQNNHECRGSGVNGDRKMRVKNKYFSITPDVAEKCKKQISIQSF